MPTQVRIFTRPKSLAESLSAPPSVPITGLLVPAPDEKQQQQQQQQQHQRQQPQPHDMGVNDDRSYPGVTFASQDKLPKLPIPDLESSCAKYLAALKPLQSAREHSDTRQAVDEFLKHEGPELQEKLKRYAEGRTSYIEQFWYDSYLNYDNPVVLNLNPFFLLEDDPTPARNNQVTRAASLVVSALEFVRAVRKEELPPDMLRGAPLDMYQYSRLFGTARVPTEAGCQIEQDPDSKHIVVLCHGQFYWFDVLDDASDAIMTERDVAVNLQTIVDDAAQTPIHDAARGALGVLSTENRKVWSGLRDVLLTRDASGGSSNNADCLGIVDSALFLVCLDYTEPATASALCQNMLCGTSEVERGVQIGTCTNRWYDKLQIIVCKNGSAGINFEHTGVDGHTVLRFASDVYTDTILRFARTINGQAPTLWASTSPDPSRRDPASFGDVATTPHKLEWDLTPELRVAVRFAEARLADLIRQNEFECLDFSAYGKSLITAAGFSPDAFVQMAFQAAHYGLYGRVECTYEPAMTKTYLHGRTEAVRTVSPESVDFVRAFWADNPAEHKVDALRRACAKHVATTKDCAKGQGCDRHLYALFCLWQRLQDESAPSRSNSSSSSSAASGYTSPASPVLSSSDDRGSSPPPPNNMVTRARGDSTHSRTAITTTTTLPHIFADSGWDKLNNTIISTSNCGNPSLRHFGFGPVSAEGFGIGYIIKDDRVAICASSKHRQTRRLVDTLESYLLEIRRVLRVAGGGTNNPSLNRFGGRSAGGGLSAVRYTRAREIDGASGAQHRPKARGRLITGDQQQQQLTQPQGQQPSLTPSSTGDVARRVGNVVAAAAAAAAAAGAGGGGNGPQSPTSESAALSSEDDELGGYGFFDAGMLLQALKARGEGVDSGETKASERAAVQARRREVGKKLRLIDY